MQMYPFSTMDEMRKRENYTQETIGEGFPIIAMSYKDGIALVTKSNAVMKKISGLGQGIALGIVGVYYHIMGIRELLNRLSRKNRMSLEKGQQISLMELLDSEDGLLSVMGKEYYENIWGIPFQVDVILAEARESKNSFYRVDFRGLPYTKEGFIVCGGTEREDGEGTRQKIERHIHEKTNGDFSSLTLDDAFRLSIDAFRDSLDIRGDFLNRGHGEVLHVGILEREKELRAPNDREMKGFYQYLETD